MRKLLTSLLLGLLVGCGEQAEKSEFNPGPADPVAQIEPGEPPNPNAEAEPNFKDPVELRQRGNGFFALEDYDNAIEWYSAAIEAKEDAKSFFNRGVAFMAKGELDKALADYDKAIQLEPTAASPFVNRGLLLQRMGKTAQGINDMSEAFKLDPKDASILLNRGLLYMNLSMLDRAIADFTQATEIWMRTTPTCLHQSRLLLPPEESVSAGPEGF